MSLLNDLKASNDRDATNATAARVNRLLVRESTEQRFETLLQWSLPANSATAQHATIASHVGAPPKEFARLIRERPRNDSFANPNAADVEHLFSTAWLLVNAADELGRLGDLQQSLEARTGDSADHLRTLASIVADRTGTDQPLQSKLDEIAELLANRENGASLEFLTVAAACRRSASHQEFGIRLIQSLSQFRASDPEVAILAQSLLADQTPASQPTSSSNANWISLPVDELASPSRWVARENHLQHTGAPEQSIIYRYPVTGNFRLDGEEFAAEAKSTGGFIYGGQSISGLFGYGRKGWNTRSIICGDSYAQAYVNEHPIASLTHPQTSPWIGISTGAGLTTYRNLQLSGDLRTLSSVPLLVENSRLGWSTRHESEDTKLWSIKDGVLTSQGEQGSTAERLLQYHRPLLEGETFTYEFFYDPGKQAVHPAIGRLAILLSPEGIHLHWATDGDHEWTGLPADNKLADPINRRGPKTLPIRNADWNQVTLSLKERKLSVMLNQAVVYERAVEDGDTRFGLFHNPLLERAQVRNAKLSGDWPAKIASEILTLPVQEVVDADLPEEIVSANVREVLRRSNELEPKEKFAFLAAWVLPSDLHKSFRLQGFFDPLHGIATSDPNTHTTDGGQLHSPALSLVSVAKQIGKLDELKATISAVAAEDDVSKQCREAMLTLIDIASDDEESTLSRLKTLLRAAEDTVGLPITSRWPDLLVASQVASLSPARELVRDWMTLIDARSKNDDVIAMRTHFQSILSSLRLRDEAEFKTAAPLELKQWIPTSRFNATSRGAGNAMARWAAVDGCVQALPGHNEDLLIYNQPLTGNYEVELEVAQRTNTDCQLCIGGRQTQIRFWENILRTVTLDGGFTEMKYEPSLDLQGPWVRQRFEMKDGLRIMYVNGRKMDEQLVAHDAFPWLAIRNSWENYGSIRDLRILGKPTIPAQLELLNKELDGWRPYYFSSLKDKCGWSTNADGELVGEVSDKTTGSGDESLLYYQRPVIENAVLDYEFYYEPNQKLVHPALDRLAFMIKSDGVGIHEVTDGQANLVNADPKNLKKDEKHQIGPAILPLLPSAWNRMQVAIDRNVLRLKLNEVDVFQCEIADNNQRLFGFFHYRDETSALVRNVVYRGSWPRELPTIRDQELSNKTVFRLNDEAEKLPASFAHDFVKNGLDNELLRFEGRSTFLQQRSADGVSFKIAGIENWNQSSIRCGLRLVGDFDVSVQYSDWNVDPQANGAAFLAVMFPDAKRTVVRAKREAPTADRSHLTMQLQTNREDGSQSYVDKNQDSKTTSGTLRLARRGSRVFMLARDQSEPEFRMVGEAETTDATSDIAGIDLASYTVRGGLAQITWINLHVRAEKLIIGQSALSAKRLFVMNADGTGLRQLTHDIEVVGDHGTPQFFANGTKVAFDVFHQSPANSHGCVIDLDGSNFRDLGIGNEPSFSPDGLQVTMSSAQEGMYFMNVDGTNRRRIPVSGWSLQFSPDGKQAAFHDFARSNGSVGANIVVVDVATAKRRSVLVGEHANHFSSIYWNHDWSPNSTEICFVGLNRVTSKHELAIVNVAGSDRGFEILRSAEGLSYDVSWHPDGKRILYSRNEPATGGNWLFMIDRKTPLVEVRIPGQPEGYMSYGSDWSPDGKQIVFAAATPQEYQEYKASR